MLLYAKQARPPLISLLPQDYLPTLLDTKTQNVVKMLRFHFQTLSYAFYKLSYAFKRKKAKRPLLLLAKRLKLQNAR